MSAMAAVKEKRVSPRTSIQAHLRYRRIPISPGTPENAMTLDVSEGGFRFRSDRFLNRNASLLLELYIPGSRPIRSLATVAWVVARRGDDGYEVGGAFVDPPHDARATLSQVAAVHC